jgi:small subunit ribosomal protein S7
MPRRTTVPRKLKYEVVPENKTIDRFVVKVMLSGKRGLAERILRETLVRLETQANRPGLEVLDLALRNATPLIEVKPRRVDGATYQVPLEVPSDRQAALALRWIVDFADARKGTPMREALAAEILEAYQGQGNAIRKRDEVHKMAQANKAFAHFRW